MNINFNSDKTKMILTGILGIALLIVLYIVIKKLSASITGFLTFGSNAEVKKEAIEKQKKRIETIKVDTKRLKYTVASYDRIADILHQELMNTNWYSSPPDVNVIRGVFRNYVHNLDQWNQLRKSFGIRENMDIVAYLRDNLISWSPISSTPSLSTINNILQERRETKGIVI
jgi:hypothetical protein